MIPIVDWAARQPCERLEVILQRNQGPSPQVEARVREIIGRVRAEGDAALVALAREIDGVEMTVDDLSVSRERLGELARGIDPGLLSALEVAADSIREFHEHQRVASCSFEDEDGVMVGTRVLPVGSAGLYVPGGTVASPSTVLMSALPASVAGVDRLVAVTPPQALDRTPALAAALQIAGVDEVYAVGGAQAIAALAFGTERIKRVHKVVGPGNIYVSAAKRQVFGAVGIDSFAGPTETVVVADGSAEPRWVAADMLAQAEHGHDSAAMAIVCDRDMALAIRDEIERQLLDLPRRAVAEAALRTYGAIFCCLSLESGCRLVNVLAPEHVELLVLDPDDLVPLIKHAGAIFMGHQSPGITGDYLAGPNHVLPTSGTSRFSSPLGVWDFVKRTSLVRYTGQALLRSGDSLIRLAEAEGLLAHARSVQVRLDDPARLDDTTIAD
jgi:histidinol dehydrogenase